MSVARHKAHRPVNDLRSKDAPRVFADVLVQSMGTPSVDQSLVIVFARVPIINQMLYREKALKNKHEIILPKLICNNSGA